MYMVDDVLRVIQFAVGLAIENWQVSAIVLGFVVLVFVGRRV